MSKKKAETERLVKEALSEEALALLPQARRHLPIPQGFPGLFPISETLGVLETGVRQLLASHDIEADALFRFAQAVRGIASNHPLRGDETLTGKVRLNADGGRRVDPPLFTYYTKYPVWTALWYQHASSGKESRAAAVYRELQSHYLAAYLILKKKGQVPTHPDRAREAGRVLRAIHQSLYHAALESVDARAGSAPKTVYFGLLRVRRDRPGSISEGDAHGLAALAQLIRLAHGFLGRDEFIARASGSGRRRSGQRESRTPIGTLHPDHSQYWSFIGSGGHGLVGTRGVAVGAVLPRSVRRRELHHGGVDPWEYAVVDGGLVATEVIAADLGDQAETDPGSLPPLQTLIGAARAKARHVAMGTQRLPVAQQRVRLAEIQDLIAIISAAYDVARAHKPRTQKEARWRVARLRTLRVAAACFVTGTTPTELASQSIPVVTRVRDLPVQYVLALNPDHRMWVRPYDAPMRSPMAGPAGAATVETAPRVVFPDTWGVSVTDESDGPATWGQHQIKTYKAHWKEVLAEHGPRRLRSKWQSLHTISSMLPSWCRSLEEGDHLAWRLLFADGDTLAAVHHYYTAYDRESLARQYDAVLTTLAEQIGLCGGDDSTGMLAPARMEWRAPKHLVGDDRVLRIAALRHLVLQARRAVEAVQESSLFEHHNAHATYLALVLALVTGYRAVRTPFVDISAVDREAGVMCLQEKDRDDGVHTRYVILPPPLLKQLDIYLRGLRRLWIRLPSRQRATLHAEATKSRDRSAFGTATFELDLTKALFLFQDVDSGTPQPVELTGANLRERLMALAPDHWPIANAGRHLLRTYLTSEGAAPALINPLMGHASYGEEPWAPASGLDPLRWREHLAWYLEKLLDDVGFEVTGG